MLSLYFIHIPWQLLSLILQFGISSSSKSYVWIPYLERACHTRWEFESFSVWSYYNSLNFMDEKIVDSIWYSFMRIFFLYLFMKWYLIWNLFFLGKYYHEIVFLFGSFCPVHSERHQWYKAYSFRQCYPAPVPAHGAVEVNNGHGRGNQSEG